MINRIKRIEFVEIKPGWYANLASPKTNITNLKTNYRFNYIPTEF